MERVAILNIAAPPVLIVLGMRIITVLPEIPFLTVRLTFRTLSFVQSAGFRAIPYCVSRLSLIVTVKNVSTADSVLPGGGIVHGNRQTALTPRTADDSAQSWSLYFSFQPGSVTGGAEDGLTSSSYNSGRRAFR